MKKRVLKVEITWSQRKAKVTSLTGGHVAMCFDLGDTMEIEVSEQRRLAPRKRKA